MEIKQTIMCGFSQVARQSMKKDPLIHRRSACEGDGLACFSAIRTHGVHNVGNNGRMQFKE